MPLRVRFPNESVEECAAKIVEEDLFIPDLHYETQGSKLVSEELFEFYDSVQTEKILNPTHGPGQGRFWNGATDAGGTGVGPGE